MAVQKKKVVVAGGSIAGQMAALALTKAGCDVTVLERILESDFHSQGAGLALFQEVLTFLDTYKSEDVPLAKFAGSDTTVLDRNGAVLGTVPWPPNTFSTNWGSLATALRSSLSKEISFGSKVTGITGTEKLTVHYENDGQKQITDVDLVVGADGANSTIRALMNENQTRKYAGYVLNRGVLTLDELPSKAKTRFSESGNIMAVSNDSNCIAYRIGETKAMWAIYQRLSEQQKDDVLVGVDGRHAYSLPDGAMRPEIMQDLKDWARKYFCEEISQAVDASKTALVQVVTDSSSTKNSFLDGKVLLVCEASALPRPHVASGTVIAAYHAQRLRDLAEGVITVDEWQRNTKEFSDTVVDAGQKLGRVWFESEGKKDFEVVLASRQETRRMRERLQLIKDQLPTTLKL